jgi:hypothetical protein
MVRFAERYGWKSLVIESFFDRAEIFGVKAEFEKAIVVVAGLPVSTVLPKTYSAVLECRVLMACRQSFTRRIIPKVLKRTRMRSC